MKPTITEIVEEILDYEDHFSATLDWLLCVPKDISPLIIAGAYDVTKNIPGGLYFGDREGLVKYLDSFAGLIIAIREHLDDIWPDDEDGD